MNPFEIIEDQIYFEKPQGYLSQLVYYFEPGTKNLIYLDLEQKKHSFETLPLEIDFNIPHHHQSLMGNDGNIYLIGGYMNNEVNKQILQLDFEKQRLFSVGMMLTPR